MQMRINDRREFSSGLFFIFIGAAAAVLATRYQIGTALQMGPGFFPLGIALIMVALGAGSIVQSMLAKPAQPGESASIVPLMLIFAGMLAFGFLIERAGLVVAIGALLFFACLPRVLEKPLEVLGIYIVLATVASFLFVYIFGLPITVLPW